MSFIVGSVSCFPLVLCFMLTICAAVDSRSLVVVILSQPNPYHLKLAQNLRDEILKQANEIEKELPVVHLSHIDFPHVGDWTILPLIPKLFRKHHTNSTWFFFVEDYTFIHLDSLLEALGKYDHNEARWLGHAVYDREPTIIHHFAFHENTKLFKYPNKGSGVAINSALLERLSTRLERSDKTLKTDFNIDSAHELALFMWNEGSGQILEHEPAFCVEKAKNCASYPQPFKPCSKMVRKQSIYFAVKTCQKFHEDRLKVVKETWGKHAVHINFFSDKEDKSIPTVSLGVTNTEHGHCKKTIEILKYVANEIRYSTEIKWILLADDDTILSVARLGQLLSCYDSTIPVALGERYGFNVYNQNQGYNYITGGGSIVLSRVLLEELISTNVCQCPSISSPDDMYLAVCIRSLEVAVTHSPLFHQARPNDYTPECLKTKDAVSFHKHWNVNPIKVYEQWFQEDDARLSHSEHAEL